MEIFALIINNLDMQLSLDIYNTDRAYHVSGKFIVIKLINFIK